MMADRSQQHNWKYLDLWDIVPATEFTNSAIHMTPAGDSLFAACLSEAIQQEACSK
jgi:hypothetical protein